jgi:hypothetical protein
MSPLSSAFRGAEMSKVENNSKDLKSGCREFAQVGGTKTSAIVKEQPSHLNLVFHS